MTTPTRPLSRWHWQNWPVLVKLIGVLLVPTIVALVVGALRIVDQAGAAPAFERITDVTEVQQQLSGVVTAIQDERDLAAAYIAGGREVGKTAVEAQFGTVDAAVSDARAGAQEVAGLEGSGYLAALERLRGLFPLRQSVVAGIDPADDAVSRIAVSQIAVSEYGAAIDPLLDADAALVRSLDAAAVSERAAAMHALLSAREQVARQHALLSPSLIVDEIDAATMDDIRAAGVRLQTDFGTVSAALGPDARARFLDPITGAPEQGRQRIIALVVDRAQAGEPPATPPADWNTRTAAVIESMVAAEQALRDEITATATALRDDARGAAGWNSVLLLFALAVGVVVSFVIARSLLGPLGVLRRSALDVADTRLPAAIASVRAGAVPAPVEPVPVHTSEEIGQVARAFDAVHTEAVRLATEQAQLRANVDDMFVNLSRRSQGLVQRQLKLIDQLEISEESPEALDNLFQLDHLATRMRRNSENLLVLAGTESATRSGRPVPVVDVLRAAVSEVEQYKRLVLQPPPDVLVQGRAAGDLVHLLAELLDNATLFSPPGSQVVISAKVLEDDSLVIEVDDCGVGMGDAELADANTRLATSPTVDASVSRRMGLFVVGRLAARHEIGVILRRGHDDVGVTAAIALPARLVRAPDAVDGLDAGAVPLPSKPDTLRRRIPELPAALNGNGAFAANGFGRNGAGGLDSGAAADWAPDLPLGSDPAPALPRRTSDRVAPGRPAIPQPAEPPQPSVSAPPPTGERIGSWDLFRSAPSEGVEHTALGVARVAHRATLDHATPIFDDVASAWFKENKPVPVQWSQEDGTAAPSLAQRQPGQAVTEDEHEAVPVPADTEPAAATQPTQQAQPHRPAADWGSGDAGWQAAEALARSSPGEVTPAGLPRRQPKAMLVPGAADSGVAAGTAAPARSAEAVRGRLASYQRGVQEGRQVRRGPEAEQDEQYPTDEETQ